MKFNSVITGHYYEDSGFCTRYNDYGTSVKPPGVTDEEYKDFDYEVYMTTDGKYFVNYDKAKAHQETLNVPELDEIGELLEKVKILCETNKDKSPLFATIKDAVSKLSGDGGSYMLDKYYDSTCW